MERSLVLGRQLHLIDTWLLSTYGPLSVDQAGKSGPVFVKYNVSEAKTAYLAAIEKTARGERRSVSALALETKKQVYIVGSGEEVMVVCVDAATALLRLKQPLGCQWFCSDWHGVTESWLHLPRQYDTVQQHHQHQQVQAAC